MPGGQIALPPEIAREIPAGEHLRIMVMWKATDTELAWRRTGRRQFEAAYGLLIGEVVLDAGEDDFVAVPVTSQARISGFDLALEDWQSAGLNVDSYVRVSKLFAALDVLGNGTWRQFRRCFAGGCRDRARE